MISHYDILLLFKRPVLKEIKTNSWRLQNHILFARVNKSNEFWPIESTQKIIVHIDDFTHANYHTNPAFRFVVFLHLHENHFLFEPVRVLYF